MQEAYRAQYADPLLCLGYMQGRCNQDPNARSVIVMITDSCPECESDHMDLQVCFQ